MQSFDSNGFAKIVQSLAQSADIIDLGTVAPAGLDNSCVWLSAGHVASLYKGMDERANGDPVERIAQAYREPLPEGLAAALEAGVAVPGFQIDVVCEALRDLITEQLIEPTFPA
eukprot:COSAG02_NODE_426_length_22559_cov_5.439403_3_plen_114_part_00